MIKAISIFIVLALLIPNFAFSTISVEKNEKKAEELEFINIRILEYGIYKADQTKKATKKEGAYAKNIELLKKTKRIPAGIGNYWGIKFIPEGLPNGEKLVVHVSVDHPPFDNPLFGKNWTGAKKSPWKITAGKIEYLLQKFELNQKHVYGEWTFYFHYNGMLINKFTFEVYNPEAIRSNKKVQ